MESGDVVMGILPEPTRDELAYAGLAHALMMATWWIGPLIIYLMKKESRFVRFHALQALFWQLIITALYFGGMFAIFVAAFVPAIARQTAAPANSPFTIVFIFAFLLLWLLSMACMVLNFVLGIGFTLKAMRGEWAGYPVIGQWARRIVCV